MKSESRCSKAIVEVIKANLTPQQIKFAELYFEVPNGSAAARTAGYSEKGAGIAASRLLKNVYVQLLLKELERVRSERTNVSGEMTRKWIAQIASADIRDVAESWDEHGNIVYKSSSQIRDCFPIDPDDVFKTIREVTQIQVGENVRKVSISQYDRLKALHMLAKIQGLYSDFNQMLALLEKYGYEPHLDRATGDLTLTNPSDRIDSLDDELEEDNDS